MKVDATLKGDVRTIGECSGTFSQALLDLDVLGSKVWIEPPPGAELRPGDAMKLFQHSLASKGTPKAWDTNNKNVVTTRNIEQSGSVDSNLLET